MTDTTISPSKAPSHIAYQISERGEKSYWTRVGVAWQHGDKNGFNVQLDAIPLDGKVTLRIASEKKE